MTNLEIGIFVVVVLALLAMILGLKAAVKDTNAKIADEKELWRDAIDRAQKDQWASIRNLSVLCDHLGVTIVQEPSRTVVRVKGAPEKGE